MMKREKVTQIASALEGLSVSDWDAVKLSMDKLFHPIKKSLTSQEISDYIMKDPFHFEDK